MQLIDLTSAELFENLLAFTHEDGREIDLHGDYACTKLDIKGGDIMFQFVPFANALPSASLTFSHAVIGVASIAPETESEGFRLETLERVRAERGAELMERTDEGHVFFLIEMHPSLTFEIRARSATLALM